MNRRMLLGDPPPIHITGQDLGRLDSLLAGLAGRIPSPILEFLRAELDRARVVDDGHRDTRFVRIGSTIRFSDEQGKVYRLTLTLPGAKPGDTEAISIMTPVGAALLGLSEGQSISYETPDNRIKTITVLDVSAD